MAVPVAVYPGSFDPITFGHVDIIRRAKKLFEQLIVAVVANPRKQPLFSVEKRIELVRKSLTCEGIRGVSVAKYEGLLIDFAGDNGAEAIVRGLRATSDFEYEFQMALTNRDLDAHIESVFFMTAGEYGFLSSSVVKEIASFNGDVGAFVPPPVQEALASKL